MKLLEISKDLGCFLDRSGKFQPIDKITKEDLLNLVNLILSEDVDFDEYDEEKIKNPAHQIVYKNIYEKLQGFEIKKKEFKDESERKYLEDYEKYKDQSSQQDA